MAEEKAKKKKPESGKRMRKWIWYVAIAILALAIGCYFLFKTGLLDFQTVDEQLAAIEAAHAIPDAENAAIIYNQLLQDEPLKDRQDIIFTLLLASKKEKCRFPIITKPQQMKVQMVRLNAMRRWSRLLISAANNDIAEGRIDAGIQKCHCIIKMGNHLCQQPVLVHYLVGIAVEALASNGMKTIILQGETTENHLKIIEAAIPQTKDNWAEVSSRIIEFEKLYERKSVSLFKRASWWLQQQFGSTGDVFDRTREIYLRLLADRRGNRILIALRRYKNKNDRWPESLDVIQSSLQAEIFVDPFNNGPFVYKLTEENFTLYSKGKNNIDEGGKRDNESGADDWQIWPTSSRKNKNEKADTQ
ncbi:MAG: hypothetical protein ACYS1A_18005 [Planctomycetota bacterium]|jgi:hypothetical protein